MYSRGVRGYIVDGGCVAIHSSLKHSGFPLFCRYFTPKDIVGRWAIESLGQPITIGGRSVFAAGDYAIADRDGIVIIPAAVVEQVVRTVTEVMATERV